MAVATLYAAPATFAADTRTPRWRPLVQWVFQTIALQTYLTAGPKETRAWTIRKGATAPEAAGVIHTDFQKGFIKAEVVSFDERPARWRVCPRPA